MWFDDRSCLPGSGNAKTSHSDIQAWQDLGKDRAGNIWWLFRVRCSSSELLAIFLLSHSFLNRSTEALDFSPLTPSLLGDVLFLTESLHFHHDSSFSFARYRPKLAELGRFACRWLLEHVGLLQGGEALPPHGTVGLQGQGDRWPVKGSDAKKVSPAVLSGFLCGFRHYPLMGLGLNVQFHLK